jgi:hypothetical protein
MIPQSSTKGAALEAPVVPRLRRSISPQFYPGLTAGPSHCRPFGLGTSILRISAYSGFMSPYIELQKQPRILLNSWLLFPFRSAFVKKPVPVLCAGM